MQIRLPIKRFSDPPMKSPIHDTRVRLHTRDSLQTGAIRVVTIEYYNIISYSLRTLAMHRRHRENEYFAIPHFVMLSYRARGMAILWWLYIV